MKILIITRYSYPRQSPRAFRTAELTEQLVKMGHDVTLYTVHGRYDYSDYEKQTGIKMRNIETRFATSGPDGCQKSSLFDRFMSHFFKRVLFWPQCEFHFVVNKIIKENPNVDMLITIALPHSFHSGAAKAKKKYPDIFPKTWICDCGDPFMLNPFFNFPQYMKRFEDMWCSMCDYISVPTATSYKGYYPQYWNKIRVIPQGFDFNKTPIAEYVPNKIPTFLFTGTIHSNRSPKKFMDYLLTLDMDYKFYLYTGSAVDKQYNELSNGKIEVRKGYSRKDIVNQCSKMDFLINIKNINDLQTPSKLIDYGISKRPILSISDDFVEIEQFMQFVNGDYSSQYHVDNLDDYKIENVANKFLSLAK